ncbi:hypothetical protein [Buchananella hordeovulneris]|uniref:Uncharacterized protein n=1 Tax=Buchananella hordeovulneris TaxID=52770 RepID=A0A1Q5PUD9_9ACTO|nr:hypothetical protein [Buchananella hordeovulneris]OKL51188.1 hypothetical protein BSZ40_08895 [Buchananella hordeovulneris]
MSPELPPFSAQEAADAYQRGGFTGDKYLYPYLLGPHRDPEAALWLAQFRGHEEARELLWPLLDDPRYAARARTLLERAPAAALTGPVARRHFARNNWIYGFTPVLVCCPRCQAPGTVWPAGQRGALFSEPAAPFGCLQCGWRAERWQGPGCLEVRRRCAACGQWLTARRTLAGPPRQRHLPVRCEGCRWDGQAEAEFVPGDPFRHDPPLDYLFGLPLWLATHTRHGWLWALNGDHLAKLRAYVGAQVRQLPPGNVHWASRLPAWIKAAKHRAEVLRALDKLADRLLSHPRYGQGWGERKSR